MLSTVSTRNVFFFGAQSISFCNKFKVKKISRDFFLNEVKVKRSKLKGKLKFLKTFIESLINAKLENTKSTTILQLFHQHDRYINPLTRGMLRSSFTSWDNQLNSPPTLQIFVKKLTYFHLKGLFLEINKFT